MKSSFILGKYSLNFSNHDYETSQFAANHHAFLKKLKFSILKSIYFHFETAAK